MLIEAIFVPEGMETRAVRSALRTAGSHARVVSIGIGPARAARSVREALSAHPHPTRALIVGVCGSVTSSAPAGSTLLYADIRGDDQARSPLMKTDTRLTRKVAASLPWAKAGVHALHQDRVVIAAREKQHLAKVHRVDAIDMESYAALDILRSAGVRTAVLRIASDGVNDDLPDLNAAIGVDGKLHDGLLFREMLRTPREGMLLAWNGLRAVNQLKRAIVRVAHG